MKLYKLQGVWKAKGFGQKKLTVLTDHKALIQLYLLQLKSQIKGTLACWYLRITQFLPTQKLGYKPGSTNLVVDALSRAPGEGTGDSGEVLVVSTR